MTSSVYVSVSSPGGVIKSRIARTNGTSNVNPDSSGTCSVNHAVGRGEAVVIESTASASVSGSVGCNFPVQAVLFEPDGRIALTQTVNPVSGSISFSMSPGQTLQIAEQHRL